MAKLQLGAVSLDDDLRPTGCPDEPGGHNWQKGLFTYSTTYPRLPRTYLTLPCSPPIECEKLGRGDTLGRPTRRSSFLGHLRKPFFRTADDKQAIQGDSIRQLTNSMRRRQ